MPPTPTTIIIFGFHFSYRFFPTVKTFGRSLLAGSLSVYYTEGRTSVVVTFGACRYVTKTLVGNRISSLTLLLT